MDSQPAGEANNDPSDPQATDGAPNRARAPAHDRPGPGAPGQTTAEAGLHALDGAIQQHNALLAATGVALRLERRGRRLALRGPLPCRHGSNRFAVQRLSLGLAADAAGLEQARLQLRRVLQQLQQQRFRWQDWSQAKATATAGQAPGLRQPTGPAQGRPGLGAAQQPMGQRRQGKRPGPGAARSGPTQAPAQSLPSSPNPGMGQAPGRGPSQAKGRSQAGHPQGPQGRSQRRSLQPPGGLSPPAPLAGVVPAGQGELDPALAAFEQRFFADPRRRRNPAGSRTTWTSAYLPYLRRLQQAADQLGLTLTSAPPPWLLEQVLESYPSSSRSRQQCGTSLAALASHWAIPLPPDWGERAGGYGLHVAQFRQLPKDEEILLWSERIPNPGWRLAYGLMATYGLRNHEIFFSDLSALSSRGDRVIRVLPTSKTGEHQVWPFQPEWVEAFELPRLAEGPGLLPPVCSDLRRTTLQQVGRRVAEQFRRYGLPLTPYDLRHAWAVRTIHLGLPDTVAARMMGHSVAIHTRTYHHWITRRDQQQAVDAALARRQPLA